MTRKDNIGQCHGTPIGNEIRYGLGAAVTSQHPPDCPCRTCRRLRIRDRRRMARQTIRKPDDSSSL